MNICVRLLGFLIVLVTGNLYGEVNYLTKVFKHQGTISDNIVCYFTKEPICNKLPQKPGQEKRESESMTFFLPMTALQDNETKSMLKKAGVKENKDYTIAFQEVTKPIKGIKIVVVYNPRSVICDYQIFDAITGDKGLVFSFHNKEILTKIKISTDPLIQFASNAIGCKKKPKIMLDLGHGGSDKGKVGLFNVKEKTINYQVGTKVASLLQRHGCEVYLTRYGDYFVALDERTTNANKKKVDLFLSIHANSGPVSASGIETYCLQSSLLKNKISQSAHENLQKIMTARDILNKSLAQTIHDSVLAQAKKMHNVTDRKVKTSVTQVLLGMDMTIPSALIEIGFLSNHNETKLLADAKYQMLIAQGISNGIINYLKKSGAIF